jgi:Ni/Fe-hydrogenase 1 B-type cytochrome subunit
MLRRLYVWEIPVRLTHWVNVLSIVVLSVTGYYIGNPWILVSNREWYGPFFMGNVRFIHFTFAFIFVASLALRTYWAFVGNEWASWRNLFPFLTADGRKALLDALKYYAFLRREPPEVIGHNALAGLTYAAIVTLYFIQVFTGFALLGETNPQGIWYQLTGWVFGIFPNQTLRLVHHLIMWLLIAFALHHVYSAFLVDSEEGNGLLSSIFSGFKFIHTELLKKVNGNQT